MKGGDKTLASLLPRQCHLLTLFFWIIRNINFFFKGPGSKYFKFKGHIAHVSITQVCHYRMEAVIDNIKMNITGCQ